MFRSFLSLCVCFLLVGCDSPVTINSVGSDEVVASVATPTITPAGGAFTGPAIVELNTSTEGATIHFTLDGSEPTQSSPIYAGQLSVDRTQTLKAFAVRYDLNDSLVSEARFEIGNEAPVWNAVEAVEVTAGTPLQVTVSATDADGLVPGLSADLSTLPGDATFSVVSAGQATLNWVPAEDLSGNFSVTLTATDQRFPDVKTLTTLSITVIPPVIVVPPTPNRAPVWASIAVQSLTEGQTLELRVSASDADGQAPTLNASLSGLTGAPTFVDEGNGSGLLRWTAPLGSAGNYSVSLVATDARFPDVSVPTSVTIEVAPLVLETVATPSISPPGGEFLTGQVVTLATTTADSALYYTLDGSNPTTASTPYAGAFTIDASADLRVLAVKDGFINSAVSQATFAIGNADPVWTTVVAQTLTEGGSLSLAVSASDSDGLAPALTADFSALPGSPTFTDNGDGTGSFTWTAPADSAGDYSIMLSAADARFPSEVITQGLLITVQPLILEVVATPTVEPLGGEFLTGPSVTLSTATADAELYYTLDGTDPTTASTLYSGAFTVDASAELRVLAVKDGFSGSAITQATFAIGNADPVWASVPDQTLTEGDSLILSFSATDSDGAAPELHADLSDLPGSASFTDNGDGTGSLNWIAPAASAGDYTITLSATDARFPSEVITQEVLITVQPLTIETVATPSIDPSGGEFLTGPTVTLATTTADAELYYTLDGSDPTTASTLYTGAFNIVTSAELRVLAVKDGFSDSAITQATFAIGNAEPVWAATANQTMTEGDTLSLAVSATDSDGDTPALSADLSDLPGNPSFIDNGNGTGSLNWTAPAASAGTYSVTLSATDARFPTEVATLVVTITVEAAVVVDADVFLQSFYADGKIVIEGDNYSSRRSAASGQTWEAESTLGGSPLLDAFGSGDTVMNVLPNNSTTQGDYVSSGARLDYRIQFDQPGTYYLWIRGTAETMRREIHVGVDGVAQSSAEAINGLRNSVWAWTNQRDGSSDPATITIDSAGEHTLNIWAARSGFTVDKILLTPDASFVPVGFGPQESARGTLPEYPVTIDSHIYSWNFNEDPSFGEAVDSIQSARLTCSSCPASASSPENQAFSFSGSQSLSILPGANLQFVADQGFAIEAVIRTTNACATAQQIVGQSGDARHAWYLACEGGKAVAYASDDLAGNSQRLVSSATINDGSWHHVALVYDPVYLELRLYVDGVEDQSNALSMPNAITSTEALTVAAGNGVGAPSNFRGDLDTLAVHGRTLRPDEISRRSEQVDRGLPRDLWACEAPVRIMPLGDSITAGSNRGGDELWGSYRLFLYEVLQLSGYNIDFVGSYTGRLAGEPDRQHEGWPGITPAEVDAEIAGWLAMNPPELVLMHLGTNGVSAGSENDVDGVVSSIQAERSDVPVVIGKIINRQTFSQETSDFNDALGVLAEGRIAAGERVYLVDHEPTLDYGTDMYDNLHALPAGAEKMAVVWLEALDTILPKCRAAAPSLGARSGLTATAGQPFRFWVPVTGHPVGAFELESAPAGMTINPTTGEVRWNSPTAGNRDFTVRVTNGDGTDGRTYTVTVGS